MVKKSLLWVGKLILCALAYYAGTILGGMLAGQLGLVAPDLPEGADAATLGLLMLIGSFAIAGALAVVARGMGGRFPYRWLTLALLFWAAYSLNTYIEASLFTGMQSSFALAMEGVSGLLAGAAAAWLFRSPAREPSPLERTRTLLTRHGVGGWSWRILAALAAFPVLYALFGTLVSPLILDYYREQQYGLTVPRWVQILPVQFLRSLIFLLACLPVLVTWHRSRRALWIALGTALFLFVGGVPLLIAHWYPPPMRVFHGLEILLDSFAHAGVLVLLLARTGGQARVSSPPPSGQT